MDYAIFFSLCITDITTTVPSLGLLIPFHGYARILAHLGDPWLSAAAVRERPGFLPAEVGWGRDGCHEGCNGRSAGKEEKKKKEKKKQANVNPGRNVSRFARAPGACLPQPPVIRGQRAALGRRGSAGPGTALTGAQPHRCRRTTAAVPAPSLRPLSGAGPALSHASPRPAAAHVLLHPSPIRPDGGRSPDARCPPQPRFAAPRRPPRPPIPSCRAPRPRGRWVRGGHLGGGRGRGAARRGCGATRLPAPSVRRAGSCGGREGARQRERRGAAGRASAGMRRGCRRGGGCRAAGRGQTAGRCGHRGSAVPGPARAVRTVEGWERAGARRRA